MLSCVLMQGHLQPDHGHAQALLSEAHERQPEDAQRPCSAR